MHRRMLRARTCRTPISRACRSSWLCCREVVAAVAPARLRRAKATMQSRGDRLNELLRGQGRGSGGRGEDGATRDHEACSRRDSRQARPRATAWTPALLCVQQQHSTARVELLDGTWTASHQMPPQQPQHQHEQQQHEQYPQYQQQQPRPNLRLSAVAEALRQ